MGYEKPLIDALIAHHLGGRPNARSWSVSGSANQKALARSLNLLAGYHDHRDSVLERYRWESTEGGIAGEEGHSGYEPHYHAAARYSDWLAALQRGDHELAWWARAVSVSALALWILHSDTSGHVRIPGPRWRHPGTHEGADVQAQLILGLPLARVFDHPWWSEPGHQRRSLAAHLLRDLLSLGVPLPRSRKDALEIARQVRLHFPIHWADTGAGSWISWCPRLEAWDNLQPVSWQPVGGAADGWLGILRDNEQVWGATSKVVAEVAGITGAWGVQHQPLVQETRSSSFSVHGRTPIVIGLARWPDPKREPPDEWGPEEPHWEVALREASRAVETMEGHRLTGGISESRKKIYGHLTRAANAVAGRIPPKGGRAKNYERKTR